MCKVDEKDEAEEQKEHGADEGEVVAPDEEEALGDQEGEEDQEKPDNDLWSPITVLDGGAAVAGIVDTEEQGSVDGMEDTKCELDAVDSDEAVALLAETGYREEVESQMLELLDRPRRKHDPRQDGVEEENQGVRDPRSGAGAVLASKRPEGVRQDDIPAIALPAGAAQCRARGGTAA